MLSKEDRERLRGLSKEHAENIGLHILAAYALETDDPKAALEHAQWAARQASRIDFSRETLAFVAYRQGEYRLALREFRTAHRMNGYPDYLPFMADCERGLGEPRKAIDIACSDEGRTLDGESKAEMFLVYAGAMADLGLWDKAAAAVHELGRARGLSGEYRMRAVQAEQYFLEGAGRKEDAAALDATLDELEARYADEDEDETSPEEVVIDYDLERLSPEMFEDAGIDPADAVYAEKGDDSAGAESETSAPDPVATSDDPDVVDAVPADEGADAGTEAAGNGEVE
ncbi:hypothetical protein [uncultured Bifidobacterium sp.]|uniref:hypothetical protein n=1 Tax=uncultured Bifidobacterium sp. TaxID=165187 RepID=UPI0028DB3338|nr:hypothetical protein [uncultured Bifidobacterium sp.]